MLKLLKCKSDINETAVLLPHIGYTDMKESYENGLSSIEDDHTGLSLLLVGSQIEGFIVEEEASHTEISKK